MTPPKPGRGGKRAGAGRPPAAEPLRSLTIRLAPAQIDRLRELGEGNASRGVRHLFHLLDLIEQSMAVS